MHSCLLQAHFYRVRVSLSGSPTNVLSQLVEQWQGRLRQGRAVEECKTWQQDITGENIVSAFSTSNAHPANVIEMEIACD